MYNCNSVFWVIDMKKNTKKLLSLFLSLVLVLTTVFALGVNPVSAATSGEAGKSVKWSYDTSTNTLTLTGTGATYNFRATNLGTNKKVPWSDYTKTMTKVVIEEGITDLGQYAFYNCVALTSVSLPSTLKTIGGLGTMTTSYGAFQACSALTSITLPNNLESIGNCAFKGCSALTSITFPDTMKNIDYGAFTECTALTTVTFGANDVDLGTAAFYNCTKIRTINWGGITKIPAYGFYGYFGSSVDFPETVTSIGFRSFAENYNLRSVTINNPDCVISTTGAGLTSGRSEVGSPFAGHQQEVTIYGHVGSTAQNFVETYTTDTTQHYTFVSIDPCDHTETYENVLVPATCLAKGTLQHICSNCSAVVKTEDIEPTGHKYNEIERYDQTEENGHIYITEQCEYCQDVKNIVTHARTGNVDENGVPTSPRYVWVDGYYEYTNSATCTTPGTQKYVCTVEGCYLSIDGMKEAGLMSQETYDLIQKYLANNETDIDSLYERFKLEKRPTQETFSASLGSHTVENWTVTKPATCTEDGEQKGKCSVCKKDVTETIKATGHIYSTEEGSDDLIIEVSAEESEDGHSYKIYQCQLCEEQPIVPTHEKWIEDFVGEKDSIYESRVISEAHCVIDGLRRDTCTVCGVTRNVVLPANGQHDWYVTRETEAKCTEAGQIYYACHNCTMTRTERTEALGHDYYKVEANSVLPTCEKNGYDFEKCSRCSATRQVNIDKLGHKVDEKNVTISAEPNCEEAGKGISVCLTCGEGFEYEIPALGHNYVDSEVDLTNENKPGHVLATPVCTRCKTRQKSEMKHKEWLEGYYTTSDGLQSTCNVQGYNIDTCTICNETRRNSFPVLGHIYNYVGDNEATSDLLASVTYQGMLYRCAICQRTYRADVRDVLGCWNDSVVNSRTINRTGEANEDNEIADWSSLLDANGDGIINAKDYALINRCKRIQAQKLEEEKAKIFVSVQTGEYFADFELTKGISLSNSLPLELTMADLDGYAKIAKLENEIEVEEEDFETIRLIMTGDVLLTENNEIIIAYKGKTINAKYVRLGRISSTDGMAEAFQGDEITINLEREYRFQ